MTLIEPHAAGLLADALEATFERDPQLYYEDGFQELADRGGRVRGAPIGEVEWVEVDDHSRPRAGAGGRLPLLTRMVGTPLAIDIGAGRGRARSRRCSPTGGSPAAATSRSWSGPGWARRSPTSLRPQLPDAEIITVEGGSVEAATELADAAARRLLRRARRHRRRAHARRRQVRREPQRRCRWSRSRRTSPTTASPRRSRRWRTAGARAPSACRCRSRSSSTSTTCAAASRRMRRSGHRRRDLQPVGDRRLAAGRARARRAGRRRRGDVRAHGGDGGPAPRRTASTTTTS